MILDHDDSHDPLTDYPDCFTCAEALHRAFNEVAGLDLEPMEMDAMIRKLREVASA